MTWLDDDTPADPTCRDCGERADKCGCGAAEEACAINMGIGGDDDDDDTCEVCGAAGAAFVRDSTGDGSGLLCVSCALDEVK